MKRLFLALITVSSLAFAQPWNTKQDLAYKLPNQDKEKLNVILASIQSLEGVPANRFQLGWNQSVDSAVHELLDQIDRIKSHMSLSGWTSSLSSQERITAIKDSIVYIQQATILDPYKKYTQTARNAFIASLNRVLSYKQ